MSTSEKSKDEAPAAPVKPEDAAEAERLKVLGNELYQKSEYEPAKHRYTEAIKKNPHNAILYANRAAVYLATKEWSEAVFDSRKAVKIDPTYAKGWSRLATGTHALGAWEECFNAWQKALDCLPKSNLTPVQETLKKQFTDGLAKAKKASKKLETTATKVDMRTGDMVWDRAAALKASGSKQGRSSCVEIICDAYQSFIEAMQYLSMQKPMGSRGGAQLYSGNPNCMEPLTNSLLTDSRVFHIPHSEFLQRVTIQCQLENQTLRGWVETPGLAQIQKEVKLRLRKEGWQGTRPGLVATIRIWVLQGHIRSQLMGHHDFAHDVYTKALTMLD